MPSSRATAVTVLPEESTSAIASRLNSSVYRFVYLLPTWCYFLWNLRSQSPGVHDQGEASVHDQGEASDWRARLQRHSLGWVCAWEDDRLVGFVNVAWDGGVHAFVLDTVVAQRNRSNGVGVALVRTAAEGCRAAGREWLHVDFEEHLRSFYFDACGFRETAAGLIAL
uniref:GNAT family N-acetyltransferase n=1 Tax=Streptomyces sp. DG1A-41 TaxID=3125779 RepID=UPI00403FE2EC